MFRIGKEEIDAVARVIESRQLFRSNHANQEVVHFEAEWAAKMGAAYSLCVSGGTCALIAALVGLEIGPGDEVLVPGYTFMATATAVLAVGAIPVLVEIDDSLTIDPEDLVRKITAETRAIIPVHINGWPANMDRIMELARQHGLAVVEDACQSDGGSYKNKRLGSIGDVGCFSFNHYKIISAGEGGALVTNNKTAYERAMVYHDAGTQFRPYKDELSVPIFLGAQYRVSEIIGAILRVQLERLDGILADLHRVKHSIMSELAGAENISFIRSNDVNGDCCSVLGFSFANPSMAREFAKSDGVNGIVTIDSGKHVYANWDPLLEKRGGHCDAVNPFLMSRNQGLRCEYARDMLPQTLERLNRSVIVHMNPDWQDDQIELVANSCRQAALNLTQATHEQDLREGK